MKNLYFSILLLTLFAFSANSQTQYFTFTSSNDVFKLHEDTQVNGEITLFADDVIAISIDIDSEYTIIKDKEYSVMGEFIRLSFSYGGNLTSLNVSNLTTLTYLGCQFNQLSSLIVSGCSNLRDLYCHNNSISTLDLEGLNSLETLNCDNNNIEHLAITRLDNLDFINCENNGLSSLEVSELPNLNTLHCGANTLSSLKLEALPKLHTFNCNNASLTSLNLNGLENLNYLYCEQNSLTELNLDGLTKIKFLYCNQNLLTSLTLDKQAAIIDINCTENQLIDIIKEPASAAPLVFEGKDQNIKIEMKADGNGGFISLYNYNLTSGHSLTVNSSDSTITFENGYFKSTTPINGEKAFITDLNWETGNLSGMITFNTPSTPSTTTITGTITLIGKEIEADQFKFELLDEENVVVATAKNNAEGNLSFTITHESQGVYNYTLKEVNDGQEGYTYDTKVYSIEVAVSLNTTTNILTSVVTVKDGDTTVSTPKFENSYSSLGVDLERVNESQITIYPNPVQNELHIESAETVISVSLFNMSGKLLIKQPVNNTHFSQQMSQLQSGIYLLKVQTGSGYKNVQIIKK